MAIMSILRTISILGFWFSLRRSVDKIALS